MSDAETVRGWLTGRLPELWFVSPPEVTVDRDEIVVVGELPGPVYADGAEEPERAATREGAARRFREETRQARMQIADELERRTGRKVAWGVKSGGERFLFTSYGAPVMTRLRQPERIVLDTLVEAGVARSRSDALAWCVRLVGRNQEKWIADLRDALSGVEKARAAGPEVA